MRGTAPFKMELYTYSGAMWETEPNPIRTLGKYTLAPGFFGWVTFEDGVAYQTAETEAK